eukprot:6488156-Amphidinium_carterae.1
MGSHWLFSIRVLGSFEAQWRHSVALVTVTCAGIVYRYMFLTAECSRSYGCWKGVARELT